MRLALQQRPEGVPSGPVGLQVAGHQSVWVGILEMEESQTVPAHRAIQDGRKRGLVQFMSMCPRCGKIQSQTGYDRDSLLRLLERGYPVEAHCEECGEFWPIGVKERAGLAILVLAR
jgi:hypothetical protein